MERNTLPKRREVPVEFTWNLADIFPSDQAWFQEYEALKDLPERIAAFQGRLGDSAEELLSYLRQDDEVSLRLEKLYNYAFLASDQDTGDAFYQDLKGKAISRMVAASGASAFAAPEIMAIPEDRLNLFFIAQPELETYRRPLERIRRQAAHILSPAEEALLAATGEMTAAPDNISSTFRDADLKFPPAVDSQGQEHPLTNGSYGPLLESSDRALRRSAFENMYRQYGAYKNTLAAALDAEFKQRRFFADARKYPDTLTAALFGNEVPVQVYTSLIEAVHANMDKMHRYVSLRKRLLGVEELHMYDVYTPIVPDAAEKIPYEQAKATVLEALAVLGEDYVALLKEGFEKRWIDVYENEGKRSGAYSSGSSWPHPYVLLNQKDTLDSMFTLAHEMGHALHSAYSCKNQPYCNSDYVIFVAEVASTCNEVLLTRYLLGKTEDKTRRAYLINHFLEQFKGTLYRQTMFAEFELEMGRMAEAGETLTADALCEKYRALNALYFGPDMVQDEQIVLEWSRIPHFFYNYYVFQYATGFAAAVALANRILTGGESAVADYKRFLSGGSSADPISLLKMAGVDMGSPAPVNDALELFGQLLDEMEELTK